MLRTCRRHLARWGYVLPSDAILTVSQYRPLAAMPDMGLAELTEARQAFDSNLVHKAIEPLQRLQTIVQNCNSPAMSAHVSAALATSLGECRAIHPNWIGDTLAIMDSVMGSWDQTIAADRDAAVSLAACGTAFAQALLVRTALDKGNGAESKRTAALANAMHKLFKPLGAEDGPKLMAQSLMLGLAVKGDADDAAEGLKKAFHSSATQLGNRTITPGLILCLSAEAAQRCADKCHLGGVGDDGVPAPRKALDEEVIHRFTMALEYFEAPFDNDAEKLLAPAADVDTEWRGAYCSVLISTARYYLSVAAGTSCLVDYPYLDESPMHFIQQPVNVVQNVTCGVAMVISHRKAATQAIELLGRALKINRKIFPDEQNNMQAGVILRLMSVAYAEVRDYLYVTGLHNKASQIYAEHFGEVSPEYIHLLEEMCSLQLKCKSTKEAEALSNKVADLKERLATK